jgi:hypothetical protein
MGAVGLNDATYFWHFADVVGCELKLAIWKAKG